MRISETIHEAYLRALKDVWCEYEHRSSPRGLPCREILDYSFRVTNPVNEPIVTHDLDRNEVIESYTAKEVELYNSCTNLASDFGKASKFWLKLANPDGTVNSAYGHLIWANKSHGDCKFEKPGVDPNKFIDKVNGSQEKYNKAMGELEECNRTPWEWAKESLLRDKDTRQAILRFSLPEHAWKGNKDFPCTMHGNFLIRDDKLHLSVIMRSNDLMLGLVYDLPWFVSLMHKMVEELKDTYPNLSIGTYTHTSHSMHIYEKDKDKVLKMLGE